MAGTLVNGVQVPFLPARGVEGLREQQGSRIGPEKAFDTILKKELQDLTFSRHAQERLESRQIRLDENDLTHLREAVSRAEEKGAQESLILLRDLAFIVSVRNRTVVTAVGADHLKENVFTNIDSAVIAG